MYNRVHVCGSMFTPTHEHSTQIHPIYSPRIPPPSNTPRSTNPILHEQVFDQHGQRLCITCCKPVPGGNPNPTADLYNALDLFCSGTCENNYYIRVGGAALRRALRKLEKGVCQVCKLDCSKVLQAIRAIEKEGGSKHWYARRKAKLAQLAPVFMTRGFEKQRDKLLKYV